MKVLVSAWVLAAWHVLRVGTRGRRGRAVHLPGHDGPVESQRSGEGRNHGLSGAARGMDGGRRGSGCGRRGSYCLSARRHRAADGRSERPPRQHCFGENDPDCSTTVDAPTSCLRKLMEKHEAVHAAACRADAARWHTLADYAREEIEAYEAERDYIEAALAKLERDCRFTLEFDSTIAGATEATRSDAKTRVDLQCTSLAATCRAGLTGSHPLNYDTRDVGPPKLVGDPMLVKLAKPCYAASKGSGNVSFEVRQAWLMRERTPPFGRSWSCRSSSATRPRRAISKGRAAVRMTPSQDRSGASSSSSARTSCPRARLTIRDSAPVGVRPRYRHRLLDVLERRRGREDHPDSVPRVRRRGRAARLRGTGAGGRRHVREDGAQVQAQALSGSPVTTPARF